LGRTLVHVLPGITVVPRHGPACHPNGPPSDSAEAVDLDAEPAGAFDVAEEKVRAFDSRAGFLAFRRAIRNDLSAQLIPKVKRLGGRPSQQTIERLLALHEVFYGTRSTAHWEARAGLETRVTV